MSINMSMGVLSQIYEEQNLNQFSTIIENVIYDGLSYRQEQIIKKYRGDKSE